MALDKWQKISQRTFKGAYSAPVNIYTYGDKTALISYGEELIGTIIESPQIAVAMREVMMLVRQVAKPGDG